MISLEQLRELNTQAESRLALWTSLLKVLQPEQVAEIGVFRGNFAEAVLKECPSVTQYTMVDPWRHLDDWNKPGNRDDAMHQQRYDETMTKTDFAKEKRIILRGTTTEVIDQIPDNSLDFVYVDGDHTLRGIAIDLLKIYPKMKVGGWIGGDDLVPDIWQHDHTFEPTFVFPFALYFAEGMGDPAYALNFDQFLIQKTAESTGYTFTDLTGTYTDTSLRELILKRPPVWQARIDATYNAAKRYKRALLGKRS